MGPQNDGALESRDHGSLDKNSNLGYQFVRFLGCTYIWLTFMVNVGKYFIHGASGFVFQGFDPMANHHHFFHHHLAEYFLELFPSTRSKSKETRQRGLAKPPKHPKKTRPSFLGVETFSNHLQDGPRHQL